MAGMFAGLCGAFWRYMDRVVLMNEGEAGAKRTMEEAESATWRTAGYTALWFYFAVWTCDRVDQGHEPWVVIENDHCGTYGMQSYDRTARRHRCRCGSPPPSQTSPHLTSPAHPATDSQVARTSCAVRFWGSMLCGRS